MPADTGKVQITLEEVVVRSNRSEIEKETPLNTEIIGKQFWLENNSSNFVKTLERLPGISSMDIGSGFSKPVIRGLGFNRIAVIDKGIMQQDQQWGADHGLEIDQYDVDRVMVRKGPMSLQYGSDAMGGVIEILPPQMPESNAFWGDVTLTGKSNNDLLGVSLMAAVKHNRWYGKLRYTGQSFGDYRVPTDTIQYQTWNLPVYDERLKNTAGNERDIAGLVQYTGRHQTTFSASNVFQKTGFFTGAHGIPDVSRLIPDDSRRNVEMPYSNVNHFKFTNSSQLNFSKSLQLQIDAGFQNNHRQEWSAFHTHYGNQAPPETNPDLELDFKLNTYTLNSALLINKDKKLKHTAGITGEYQQNRIAGYSYLLPEYHRILAGGYWITSWEANEKWSFTGGLRYDRGHMDVTGYYDETLYEYLLSMGYPPEEAAAYAQRSYDVDRSYGNFSGSLGANFRINKQATWKINIGQSFRLPGANELASNGVHHGAFRHEKGNPGLDPEQGFQLDAGYVFDNQHFYFSISPFLTYFSNFIFLNPTGQWSVLPHAGQIYQYTQAKALMTGGEWSVKWRFYKSFSVWNNAEYVWNKNLADDYPLPFSPPLSTRSGISYSGEYKALQHYSVELEYQYIAAQYRVARNEQTTPSAQLLNFSAGLNWKIGTLRFSTDLQIQNLFNTKYYNHLSFYRKLNIPEPGRNTQLIIRIPFYKL